MTLWDLALSAWSIITLSCQQRDEDVRASCAPALLELRANPEWTTRIIQAAETVAEVRGGYDTERRLTRDLALDLVAKADPQIMAFARHALRQAVYPYLVAHCSAREAELVITDSFVVRYDPADAPSLQDGKPPRPDFAQHVDASLFSAQIVLSASDVVGVFGPGEVGNLSHHAMAHCEEPLCDFKWRSQDALLEASPQSLESHDGIKFQGGGTRFSGNGRNVSFLPPVGGMLAHGGLLEHGADPVLRGRRYILAFFIDELSCTDEVAGSRYKELAHSTVMLQLRQVIASQVIAKANRSFFFLLCFFGAFAVFAILLSIFGTPKAEGQFSAGDKPAKRQKKKNSKTD